MVVLSEFYNDNQPIIERKNDIAPIDFTSIKQIPESYAWSTESYNRNRSDENVVSEWISVIDIDDSNASELIFSACETWGIFQASNHGIPIKLLEEVEYQTRRLFSLPLEQKMKVSRTPEGATGYGSPRISRFFDKLMWYEGFTIMNKSFVEHAKVLWPKEYEEFCNVMDEYQTRMKSFAEKLLVLILKSLEIPESDPIWAIKDPNPHSLSTALQLNSYPSCPDAKRTMGLAQHTDTFLFTILHQSGNSTGLQVFKEEFGWVPVEPKPETLVVNVGDLLHMISNARFPSVLHRAVVNSEMQRISLAYFYGPSLGFEVGPFLGYKGCDGPCVRTLKVMDYVSIKAQNPEVALSNVRLTKSTP